MSGAAGEWSGDAAIRACDAVIRQHSKSFSFASRLLPRQARAHAVVLYAYCRHVDDAIDEVEPSKQSAALDSLFQELDRVYDEAPITDDILLSAFQAVVRERRLPRAYPEALLTGMRWDAEGHTYRTTEELYAYCKSRADRAEDAALRAYSGRPDDRLEKAVDRKEAVPTNHLPSHLPPSTKDRHKCCQD